MRFKLLTGQHTNEDGTRVYNPGDTIEAGLDSKGDPVDLCERFLNKFEKLPDEPEEAVPESAPKSAKASAKGKKSTSAATETASKGRGTKEEKETEEEPLGEDVTDKFPKAPEAGLKVYKEGRHYFVADEDDEAKSINAKELTSIEQVNSFIDDYDAEYEDEE